MNNFKFLRIIFCVAFATIAATINLRAAETNPAAQAWQQLTNFSLSPPPMSWQTNPPMQADVDKFDSQRAVEASALANLAHDFYVKFPGDKNAPRARTTEIQALQLAVRLGQTNREAELITREKSFVADTNAPTELRYELKLDLVGRQFKAESEAGADMSAEKEKAGRELVKEFPAGPIGYELLLDVAATGDMPKTRDLAEVMANSGGPSRLTALGMTLLNQLQVVGKPLPISFTAADGREINSTTISNKVVLVDFWATWCPICVQAMPDVKRLYEQYHMNGLEVIGVNFDDDTNTAAKFISQNDLPWPQFLGGFSENKYGRQFGTSLPYVWLVDKKGIVRDIHGRVNTEAKIKKLLAED